MTDVIGESSGSNERVHIIFGDIEMFCCGAQFIDSVSVGLQGLIVQLIGHSVGEYSIAAVISRALFAYVVWSPRSMECPGLGTV